MNSTSAHNVPKSSTSSLSVTKVPLHGASRTTRTSLRTDPLSPGRRNRGRPLPTRDHVPSHYSSLPSPPFTSGFFPPPMVQNPSLYIDDAIKTVEENFLAEITALRTSCSQAVLCEQLKTEKIRAQSLSYLKERNYAWARLKALLAEKRGRGQAEIRRARSLCVNPPARNHSMMARQARSMSPILAPLQAPSTSPASSRSSPDIKQEEEPISLSNSRTNSPVSPTETLVASPSDPWALIYPDSSKAPSKAPSSSEESSQKSITLTDEHIEAIFKKVNQNLLVCRMCIVKRNNLPKEQQRKFRVTAFPIDTSAFNLHAHCIHAHVKESIEIAGLPRSAIQAMVTGFAKTDRDEDFRIETSLRS